MAVKLASSTGRSTRPTALSADQARVSAARGRLEGEQRSGSGRPTCVAIAGAAVRSTRCARIARCARFLRSARTQYQRASGACEHVSTVSRAAGYSVRFSRATASINDTLSAFNGSVRRISGGRVPAPGAYRLLIRSTDTLRTDLSALTP